MSFNNTSFISVGYNYTTVISLVKSAYESITRDNILACQIILMVIHTIYVLWLVMLSHRTSKRSENVKVLEKNLLNATVSLRNDRMNHENIVQFFERRLEAFEKDKGLFAADKELLAAYINDNRLMNEFDTKIKTLSTELSNLSISFISSYVESKSLLRTRTIISLEARLKEYQDLFGPTSKKDEVEETKVETKVETEEVKETNEEEGEVEDDGIDTRRSSRIKLETALIKKMIKVSATGESSFFETESSKKLERIMKDNGIGYKYRSKPLPGYSIFSLTVEKSV